jgi:hypothetical protein
VGLRADRTGGLAISCYWHQLLALGNEPLWCARAGEARWQMRVTRIWDRSPRCRDFWRSWSSLVNDGHTVLGGAPASWGTGPRPPVYRNPRPAPCRRAPHGTTAPLPRTALRQAIAANGLQRHAHRRVRQPDQNETSCMRTTGLTTCRGAVPCLSPRWTTPAPGHGPQQGCRRKSPSSRPG